MRKALKTRHFRGSLICRYLPSNSARFGFHHLTRKRAAFDGYCRSKRKKEKALSVLKSVGLTEEESHRRILKLSGGQQQRVAIARALSYDPDIILADEPTGNLDTDTQRDIMQIFKNLAQQGKCVILVSHSPEVAAMCDERYELKRITK